MFVEKFQVEITERGRFLEDGMGLMTASTACHDRREVVAGEVAAAIGVGLAAGIGDALVEDGGADVALFAVGVAGAGLLALSVLRIAARAGGTLGLQAVEDITDGLDDTRAQHAAGVGGEADALQIRDAAQADAQPALHEDGAVAVCIAHLHDIADARLVLEDVSNGTDTVFTTRGATGLTGPKRGLPLWLGAIGLLAIIGLAAKLWLTPPVEGPTPIRLSTLTFSGNDWSPTASPDGDFVPSPPTATAYHASG